MELHKAFDIDGLKSTSIYLCPQRCLFSFVITSQFSSSIPFCRNKCCLSLSVTFFHSPFLSLSAFLAISLFPRIGAFFLPITSIFLCNSPLCNLGTNYRRENWNLMRNLFNIAAKPDFHLNSLFAYETYIQYVVNIELMEKFG